MSGAEPLFRHDDAGTPEWSWLAHPGWSSSPVLSPKDLVAAHPKVVVAAAHPDDETLAVGALVADLADAGADLTVVAATAGEASHPDSTTWPASRMATTRLGELERAAHHLAPGAQIVHLGLPDGALAEHEEALADELTALVDSETLLLATWCGDGHPDHDALGRAATVAASRTEASVLHYPIWLWHWANPESLDWDTICVVEPSVAALRRKRAALAEYRSQLEPLGPLVGDEPVVTDEVLRRARRLVEVLVAQPGTKDIAATSGPLPAGRDPRVEGFDAMYEDGPDPWGFTNSFYEARKRDLTLAMLGRPRYQRVLDVGCADGVLTRALATRAEQVTAVDVSSAALKAAAADGPVNVEWVCSLAYRELPKGPFELVVLSEVGYFLTPVELLATLRSAREALAPGGELLLCHWQHPSMDLPLDGALVHEQAAAALDLPLRAAYRDVDVCLEIWGEPTSVAAEEGRT